jgi:hypothetical protein
MYTFHQHLHFMFNVPAAAASADLENSKNASIKLIRMAPSE